MPRLTKKCLSQFIRTGCLRRLRLDLYPETGQFQADRTAQQMPAAVKDRPEIAILTQAGREWEHEVFDVVIATFQSLVCVDRQAASQTSRPTYRPIDLDVTLTELRERRILIEPTFDPPSGTRGLISQFPTLEHFVSTELAARGEHFSLSQTRPDLIFVSEPLETGAILPPFARFQIQSDGTVTEVADGNGRQALRVVDIKLTSSPSAAYLCEVAWYAWALAAWLEERGLANQFYVSASPSVWPGSHTGSALERLWSYCRSEGRAPTHAEAWAAIEEDIQAFPVEMFLDRVRAFMDDDVVRALQPEGTAWRSELPWHVDSRCIGCDWLAYPWAGQAASREHCWGEAEASGHLSRIAGLTRGGAATLRKGRILDVSTVARTTPANRAYGAHYMLRAKRTAIHARAEALEAGSFELVPRSGGSAVLPAWSDVSLFVRLDFDVASGMTFCFSVSGIGPMGPLRARVFPVATRSLQTEQHELISFLREISSFLTDPQNATNRWQRPSTFQIYIWDELTLHHLERVIGRHLDAILGDPQISDLAWLFPPEEEVVADPELSGLGQSISVVRHAVDAAVAADIPHHYSLLEVANRVLQVEGSEQISISSYFRDPLSDQIPSERAHEIWAQMSSRRSGSRRTHHDVRRELERTVPRLLFGLSKITEWVREQLRGQLTGHAPAVSRLSPRDLSDVRTGDFKLIYAFAQLNAAIKRHETEVLRAMERYEREARHQSIHLIRRLTGEEERQALQEYNLEPTTNRMVFEISPRSRDAKIREGDFTWSVLPERNLATSHRHLDWHAQQIGADISNLQWFSRRAALGAIFQASLERFDSVENRVVIHLNSYHALAQRTAFQHGIVDLIEVDGRTAGQGASFDPWPSEFFLKPLRQAMRMIGNPPSAQRAPLVDPARRIHVSLRTRHQVTEPSSAEAFIWLAGETGIAYRTCDSAVVSRVIESFTPSPTERQAEAIRRMASRRLSVLWGPPGTGKSVTTARGIFACFMDARERDVPLRVLVTGPTWIAIKTVFEQVVGLADELGLRITPYWLKRGETAASLQMYSTEPETVEYDGLVDTLWEHEHLVLVGATSLQAARLARQGLERANACSFFDYVVVDEASQVDLANLILSLQAITDEGALCLIGDDLQMPPIHEAEPPLELADILGSAFDFYTRRHGVEKWMLDRSFRSNQEIIDFVNTAGYLQLDNAGEEVRLEAQWPARRIALSAPIPIVRPDWWPDELPWSSDFADIVDPEKPLVAIRHFEGVSAQSNQVEAEWVAALVRLLAETLVGYTDEPDTVPARPTLAELFHEHIGIVTPHRAQMSSIATLIERTLPNAPPDAIRAAVDTVERFQGQERTVILASMSVGDPDAIAQEEEFLLSLERFNVTVSRARAKLIVMMDEELWRHLPHDVDVLRGADLLKRFAGSALPNRRAIDITRPTTDHLPGELRWR